jgi:hypothetical protein
MAAWRREAAAMAAIVAALGALTIAFGERIGVNQGQGWDGMAYTQWAQAWWDQVVGAGVTQYQAQRVLPSAIVHFGLRAAGQAPTVGHVIVGFQILDTAMLAATAALWAHLGAAMGWRRPARWVGFAALFAGFASARHALYYPTLTDPTAFTLGMAVAWGYLAGRPIALAAAAALAAVTWPALTPIALVLLVLPRREGPVASGEPRRRRAAAIAAVAAIAYVAIGLCYRAAPAPGVGRFTTWVRGDLLWLTVPLLVATIGAGAYVVAAPPAAWDLRGALGGRSRRGVALALATAAAILLASRLWVARIGTRGPGFTTAAFLDEHTQAALRGPLWGPVFDVVYFGPLVLVATLRWRRIAAIAAAWGPGAVIALAMTLAFAISAQARQWVHLWPLLVALAIAATAEVWTAGRAAGFAALALAWSKLWLTIGYDVHVDHRAWPNQRYYMQLGPWASDGTYVVHLAACAVSALAIAALLRRPAVTAGGRCATPSG